MLSDSFWFGASFYLSLPVFWILFNSELRLVSVVAKTFQCTAHFQTQHIEEDRSRPEIVSEKQSGAALPHCVIEYIRRASD